MVRGEAPLTLASTSTISVKVQNLLPPLGRQQRVVVVHSVTMEIVVVAGVILRHVSCVPRLSRAEEHLDFLLLDELLC